MLTLETIEKLEEAGLENPTFHEAVKACGGWFNSLTRQPDGTFVASGMDGTVVSGGLTDEPTEAVCILYLKIQERINPKPPEDV